MEYLARHPAVSEGLLRLPSQPTENPGADAIGKIDRGCLAKRVWITGKSDNRPRGPSDGVPNKHGAYRDVADPAARRHKDVPTRASWPYNSSPARVEAYQKRPQPWLRGLVKRHLAGRATTAVHNPERWLSPGQTEVIAACQVGGGPPRHQRDRLRDAKMTNLVHGDQVKEDQVEHQGRRRVGIGGHQVAGDLGQDLGRVVLNASLRCEDFAVDRVCDLRLAPLVFVRPGELRKAEWKEIDLSTATWNIPAERMRMKEAHVVPLSKQAVEILTELHPLTGRGTYLFPSPRSSKRPMSDNAILSALRRMGVGKDEMTGHGFRAMARTVLDEVLHVRPDYIEHQLAHAVRDPNGRAYNRTAHLPERRKMMKDWADYLDKLRASEEHPISLPASKAA